jgi:hypothetical protein
MSEQTGVRKAFAAAWKDVPRIGFDSKNPRLGNDYASYDKIMSVLRPILNKHSLILSHQPCAIAGHAAVRTVVIHAETGEELDLGTTAVPAVAHKGINDAQAYGSSQSYAVRYSLRAAFALTTGEDDDAEGAGGGGDPRVQAYTAVRKWCGLEGDDLNAAAKSIAELPDIKGDPMKIIAYCELHGSEDFVEHMNKIKENAQ